MTARWMVTAAHSLDRDPSQSGVTASQLPTPAAIAAACTLDPRFSYATVPESCESIATLTETEAFALVLKRIAPANVPVSLGVMVSSVYACRVEQKQLPKRPAKMR